MEPLFIGVDVQTQRGVPVAIMDVSGEVLETDWFTPKDASTELYDLIRHYGAERCFVGIDAPRCPLKVLRTWSFVKGRWCRGEGIRGRHCELVINSLHLANPQWTPLLNEAPAWMVLGFELFTSAEKAGASTYEVFPSASYNVLDSAENVDKVTIPFTGMACGPKDMLDAVVGAFTVLRFKQGVGSEVGGGDGLGTIILPAMVVGHPVNTWPSS